MKESTNCRARVKNPSHGSEGMVPSPFYKRRTSKKFTRLRINVDLSIQDHSQARKLLISTDDRKDLRDPLTAVREIFDTVSAVGGILLPLANLI